jgi:hypothetical protein
MVLVIVINIASPGDTIVEKSRLNASKDSSFKNIPTVAKKNIESRITPCESNIPIRIVSSIMNTNNSTTENHVNLPMMIIHRRIGFDSIR